MHMICTFTVMHNKLQSYLQKKYAKGKRSLQQMRWKGCWAIRKKQETDLYTLNSMEDVKALSKMLLTSVDLRTGVIYG